MAGSTVKIVKGNLEGNELENAASEYTLQQLLASMQRLEKQTGPNSKKAAAAQEDNTKKVKDNTKATEELSEAKRTLASDLRWLSSRGFRLLGQGITSFASGLTLATQNISNFAADIIQSQPEITDFTGALANSRLDILGLGTAIHRITQLLVGNYRSFQTLTQSGIALGGRISELQSDFASMGVDASTLTSALAENAHMFAMYGSASSAATRALDGMRRITNSTREELMRYGLSFEEQTDIFTSMYARNTRALRSGLTTTNEINNQSVRYAKSLRSIAELTGVNAKELQDQQDRLAQEQALQSKLDQLRAQGRVDEATRIEEYISYMESSLGEGGRDIAIAQAMGTTATTEAAIALQGYMNNVNEFSNDMYQASLNTPDAETFRNLFASSANQLAQAQTLSNDLTTAQALIFAGEGQVVNSILKFTRMFGGNVEDASSMLGEVDEAGNTIMTLDQAILAVRTGFADLASSFLTNETVQRGMASFREWIGDFTVWLRTANFDDFFTSIFGGTRTIDTPSGPQEVDVPSLFERLMDPEGRAEIIESIKSFLTPILGEIGTYLFDLMKDGVSYLWNETNLAYYVGAMVAGIAALWAAPAVVSALATAAMRSLGERGLGGTLAAGGRQLLRRAPIIGTAVTAASGVMDDQYQEAGYGFFDRAALGIAEGALDLVDLAANVTNSALGLSETLGEADASGAFKDWVTSESGRSWLQFGDVEEQRRIGTLKATGMKSEPRDTVAQIHQGERVLNPQETTEYNNQSDNQRQMVNKLDELNTSMRTMINLMTQELSIQSRTMNSISGLGPDLMKGIPG